MADKIGVFVSHHHSRLEDAYTRELVTDLERAGADVWVDYQGITSGSFPQKINEGMAGRHWLVLVMTPGALLSRWVRDEVNAALNLVNGGRMYGVIPFVMFPCDEGLIPPLWAQLHRYDATKNYKAARDGMLRAMGLRVPDTLEVPGWQSSSSGESHLERKVNVARLKTWAGLQSLSPRQFEEAVGLMLTANGFKIVRRADGFPDVADWRCKTPDRRRALVWCFKQDFLIPASEVLTTIRILSADEHANLAIMVTLSGYSASALDVAKSHKKQIRLVDGQQVIKMMQHIPPQ